MTVQEFQLKARLARARAERITAYRRETMRRALDLSGIGRCSGLNVLHNALLAHDCGKPWQEVNYSAARLALRLESTMDVGHRIADAYVSRMLAQLDARR